MPYYVGMVTFYQPEKGYGFLWSEQDGIDYFFHIKDYKGEKGPERGDVVSFCATSSDRGVQAKEVRLLESGKLRDPALVGITCWTGPGRSGEYGLVNHKGEKGNGTFIHKTCLVDETSNIESNILYKLDVAKERERYVGLNVRKIQTNDEEIISKIAYNKDEDPRVRLKALEILFTNKGQQETFDAAVQRLIKNQPSSQPEVFEFTIPKYFTFKQKGTPSDNTVKIVNQLTVGACVIFGIAAAAWIVARLYSEGGSSSTTSDLSGFL